MKARRVIPNLQARSTACVTAAIISACTVQTNVPFQIADVTWSRSQFSDFEATFTIRNLSPDAVCFVQPARYEEGLLVADAEVGLDSDGRGVLRNGDPASAFGLDARAEPTERFVLRPGEDAIGRASLLGDTINLDNGDAFFARIRLDAVSCDSGKNLNSVTSDWTLLEVELDS